jgi:hypothetical protein
VLDADHRGDLFHDGQHPTLDGYVAIAQDLLEQLRARRAFGWPESTPVPRVDPVECALQFKLDAQQWARICRRSADFYGRIAYIRYDPSPTCPRSSTRTPSSAYSPANSTASAGSASILAAAQEGGNDGHRRGTAARRDPRGPGGGRSMPRGGGGPRLRRPSGARIARSSQTRRISCSAGLGLLPVPRRCQRRQQPLQ